MSTRRVLPILAVVVFMLLASAPALLAAADVKVNGDAAGSVQNEVRITRNATDLQNFVVAYNDSIGAATSPLGSATAETAAPPGTTPSWRSRCIR